MESYIKDKKSLYNSIMDFLDELDEYDDNDASKKSFEKLITLIKSQQIEEDAEEMRQFLELIKSIGDHHQRYQEFNERIFQLLLHYKTQIKQTLTNSEIFQIFENNKKLVLFLIQKGIITISEEIYEEILNKIESNGNSYCHFFIPELENFAGEERMKFIKDELLKDDSNIFTNYEEKREIGENDSYICSLIREDSINDFISHISRFNISPSSIISPSIFETNLFLINNKNTSLIEYSAFFGSIQIFRYLKMKIDELKPKLWLYAIHSNNVEIINLLEDEEVPPPINYAKCFIESIKCHHNNIAFYIKNNLMDSQQNEVEIFLKPLKYHNYLHFKVDTIINHGFFYLHFYHYKKLFDLLLKQTVTSNSHSCIQKLNIRKAADLNLVKIIYLYLSENQKISENLFGKTKIKQIAIPSTLTSIPYSAFSECSSLRQISFSIPSSVTSIEHYAFAGCLSLRKVTIPSSVTSIGHYAFAGCSLLRQITIPSSVTSIGQHAFDYCYSLTQVTFSILSSLCSLSDNTFFGCSSLKKITIPSSVTNIGKNAFSGCSSLKKITIPSSIISIGENAFSNCQSLDMFSIIPCTQKLIEYYDDQFLIGKSNPNRKNFDTLLWAKLKNNSVIIPKFITKIQKGFTDSSSLTKITFETPSSITSIENYVFSGCLSLTQISIPSSVTKIGEYVFNNLKSLTITGGIQKLFDNMFKGCSSLKQITISSSVTSIGNYTFSSCSRLTQITIPSSVISIGNYTFSGCSSLTQITIPSSVTSIGDYAFEKCSSLAQIIIPSSVTKIGGSIFIECKSLTQITIPSSITSIKSNTLRRCSSLTEIIIPSSVTSIGDYAFSGCSSLTQITIPSSVTKIGEGAFSFCSSLTKITIPSSVTELGRFAFRCSSSLAHITIPSSIDTSQLEINKNTVIEFIN